MQGFARFLIWGLFLSALTKVVWAGPMGQFFTEESSRLDLFPVFRTVELDTLKINDSTKVLATALLKSPVSEKEVIFERILSKEGLAGYIYRGREMGKVQLMDFAVSLDAQGKVIRVVLTAYRESVGGEVKSKRFMQQFQGKASNNSLQLNHDIDGISGATLSSRAITLGVRKAVCFWKLKYGSHGQN
jgi:hypothetical protein